MVARRGGDLVLISSDVVDQPRPLIGAYVSSKWAAEGLVRTLQMELEGTGVRASIVRPGPTATEISTGWDVDEAVEVVKLGKKFGSLRHYGWLHPSAVAQTVAHVVAAPRGTHLALVHVTPEAPVAEDHS
jgi:NADP-dependent 3-hydroxy acid dehydrogenase YdfG